MRFHAGGDPRDRTEALILAIPDLISRLVPHLFRGSSVSVACVRTTRPTFLVFGADELRPACIIQFGPKQEMERAHNILGRLHGLLPGMVAEPLVCQPWRERTYVSVQAGLPGIPWFRLANKFRSAGAWAELRGRAVAVLRRLHAAVREVPEWSARVNLAKELRGQVTLCAERGQKFSSRAQDGILYWSESLETLTDLPYFWQHGDFCLNNLLVSSDQLAVIDLEEFGRTSVPLHDEFGLALSVNALAREAGLGVPLVEDLRACHGASVLKNALGPEHLPGLFLHHLLWRINQCHRWPTRARIRTALVALVEQFAANPRSFIPHRRMSIA
jgi:phosphotransferase family enzyme